MTRSRQLPKGWYPADPESVRVRCDEFIAGTRVASKDFCSVVVPHAGWEYSGELACRTIARLSGRLDTVVVVGGHLRTGDSLLIATEDAVETPLGDLQVNSELSAVIRDRLETSPDRTPDNTIEVQLPFIAYLHNMPKVVLVRCPPTAIAAQLGELIAEFAMHYPGIAVVGSTDLTHYGPAYGFTEHGGGRDAVTWVKGHNDTRLVDALLAIDSEAIVAAAASDRSACSAGGAAAAAAFARATGCNGSELVGYFTSYDVSPNDSFVGYAGVGYFHSRGEP